MLVVGIGIFDFYKKLDTPTSYSATIIITPGMSISEIAQKLYQEKIIPSVFLFPFMVHVVAQQKPLKAGEYFFEQSITPRLAIDMMARGQVVVRKLTVPEGLTIREIIDLVNKAEGLKGDILQPLPKEGDLLPETYFYSWGDQKQDLIKRMSQAMKNFLTEVWPRRNVNSFITTPYEAIILASIVEKETGLPNERPRVASVFLNRLKIKMRLQSDPTVIYALTDGQEELNRSLVHNDLQIDNPYNTYMYEGLPPGPIANPGKASIEAVLKPENTDELYFVADGKGGHVFAKTLTEHNRNVTEWRKIQSKN
ncbi:MAG: endolytic transglycosylase MltG [Alphaproteobacteria bacterium]|nr:endolytic transglycosylase MltG [Alphaproteobacteria bacterium]